MSATEPPYLYLNTIGWKTGKPHEIEIWFVEHDGSYYLCAEGREKAHWVQNIQHQPAIQVRIGSREAVKIEATGRVVSAIETDLQDALKPKMQAKYGWNDGLFIELKPKP
jgi:deazaflavin-dependent oxidoreductase (nitroreductase family)